MRLEKFINTKKGRILWAYLWGFLLRWAGIITWERKSTMGFKVVTISLRQGCPSRGGI